MLKTMFNLPKISGNKMIFFLIIVMALIAWSPKQAMATTWTVCSSGCDFTSINGALEENPNLADGDTVYVYNGSYIYTGTDYVAISKSITLKGEGADVVTYDMCGYRFSMTGGGVSDGTIIEGLKIVNSDKVVADMTDCIIRNCVFEGITYQYGIPLGPQNNTFRDNVVTGATGAFGAVHICGDSCTIVNNTIINNNGAGLLLYPSTTAANTNNIITKNNLSSNGKGFFLYNAGEGNKIYLNNIVDNTESVAYGGTSPTTIYWNSTSQIVYVYNSTSYTGQMGNYWSDYTGTDADGDGIGDTPYPIPGSATDQDSFPLIAEFDYNNYLIPDFNLNGYVDAADLQLLGDHWHFVNTNPGWDALYDLVPDNIIDAADLQVFGDHWHEGTPPTRSGQEGSNGRGPNENAGIVFDLAAGAGQSGNDGVTGIPSQPPGTHIRVDVYCTDVVNLDTYEFEVIYNATELEYVSSSATNPITYEGNILESNGGTALGWMVDSSTPGVLSIAYTLAGNDPDEAPEGEGLIADIVFLSLVDTYGTLTFGDVYYYDSYGVVDLITNTGNATLPVELSSFTVQFNGSSPVLCWTTQSETDNAGWNVYRSVSDNPEDMVQINYTLIPGAGSTSIPTDYSFEDEYEVVANNTYYYWIESVDYSGETCLYGSLSLLIPEEGTTPVLPQQTILKGNYPNPFNPDTIIEFDVKENENASLIIYNVKGQLIETKNFEAGKHNYFWDASSFCSGVYFYKLESQAYSEIRKMILLK